MKIEILISIFLFVTTSVSFPQTSIKRLQNSLPKNTFYFTFGWHRAYYTNSTIHFKDLKTANYDFKLIKAKAIDDNDLRMGRGIDAPQYSVRLGLFFKNKPNTGIEINFDHAKYILKQGQQVHIEGSINGRSLNKDTLVHPEFIEYEHTHGANYWMINVVKQKNIWQSNNQKYQLAFLLKPGIGLVIPHSDIRLFGKPGNDKYHVSGYMAGVESGLHAVLFKNLVAEFTFKGAYANYADILLYRSGRARQHWWSYQYIMLVGYQFSFTSKKK
jgi:hypothetical protein